MVRVWLGLLGLTAAEVALAYIQVVPWLMLALLLGFSVVKAAMIMAYFMHLKYDPPALAWMLAPPLAALLVVLIASLAPDSLLLLEEAQR